VTERAARASHFADRASQIAADRDAASKSRAAPFYYYYYYYY